MKNCFICNKNLNKLNTPLKGLSKTKDENIACTSCHRKVSLKLNKINLNDEVSQNILEGLKTFEVKKQDVSKREWYEKKRILIPLLFLFPPFGIYGIFKKDTDKWKMVIYTLIGIFMSIYLLGLFLVLALPNINYTNGNNLYKQDKYEEAISEYKKVKQNDENYTDALQKIELAQSKLDSISLVKKQIVLQRQKDSIVKIEKQNQKIEALKLFQKQWADSLMKSAYRGYLNNYTISDTNNKITFYLNPANNKLSNNDDINLSIFQKDYDKRSKVESSVEIAVKLDPKKEERQNLIYKQFSNWDGSHRNLKRYVKSNMNDPKSFEHIETTYTDKGTYLYVYMKFRGSNAFGATVLNTIRAKVDLQGNILSTKQL